MRSELAVLSSDAMNRYRFVITVNALEGNIFSNSVSGLPFLLNHDAHRPIGWHFPFGLFLEPKLSRVVGQYVLSETEDDREVLSRKYNSELTKRHFKECEPYREELDSLIAGFKETNGLYYYTGCAAYNEANITYKIFPFLNQLWDKDHLIYLSDLLKEFDYLGQGVFKYKLNKLTIFCHQFFRRNLSYLNSFNVPFLERFISLNSQDLKPRIAIDGNLIGLSSSFHFHQELAYHYGPHYNDDIEKITPNVTRYECDDRQKYFSGISAMEFWWKAEKESRILEAEEIRDTPSRGVSSDHYGCRYVHSIYDTEHKEFEHFDGAIRMYPMDQMIERLDKSINKAGKHSQYTKLFRIDKNLKIQNWKSLITDYFQDNPLIYEYFGHKQEYDQLVAETVPQEKKTIMEQYVPFNITADSGLRIFLSYHKPTLINHEFTRIVINPDFITGDENPVDAVEFYAIEIKKTLERIGEELIIPETFQFISVFDDYCNFPTILHSKENLEHTIDKTIEAYLMLFKAMAIKREMTISFTLAFPIEDKEVRLSVFGKVSEIVVWLKEIRTIPVKYPAFRKWIGDQSSWLGKRYEAHINRPDIFDLVCPDGVLFIKRRPVPQDWIEFKETEKGLTYSLHFPEGETELFEAFKQGDLEVAVSYILKKATCSRTGENYFHSKTSKILDNDVLAVIEDVSSLTAYWTA